MLISGLCLSIYPCVIVQESADCKSVQEEGTMKAAVFYEYNAPLKIETIELDKPKRAEVLVKVAASGVCHSDLSVMNGTLPFPPPPAVLGHEGAGIVEEVGADVTSVQRGDHVILSWRPSCGKCGYCVTGRPQLCQTG